MHQIVITPVTGKIKQAMTEAYSLYVAGHRDLFGEEYPTLTISRRIVMPLIRGMGNQELQVLTRNLVATGFIESVHIEVPNNDDDELDF